MLRKLIIILIAPALYLSGTASARETAASNLFLRVGPGVTATFATSGMHYMCGDGNCQFAMPANSTFEVVAEAGSRHQLQWDGCAWHSDTRCRVEVRDNPVSISVR